MTDSREATPSGLDLERRVTELEAKLALGEDLLENINHALYRQQAQLDLLQREFRLLYQQVQANIPADEGDPREETPPHY